MTNAVTGAASTLKLANQARQLVQGSSNPLVAVRHGRREDRAVAYDRFLSLCLCFYRLRRDRCDPNKRGEDVSALEGDIPMLVDELHAALYAIELRAPAEMRKTARHLFWRIVGFPSDPDSLYKDWRTGDLEKSDHAEILLSHIFVFTPVDPSPSAPSIDKLKKSEQRGQLASRYASWRVQRKGKKAMARRENRSSFWDADTFRHGTEFLEGIGQFSWVARIDVNGRWRWWHWPMALIPPLKRWHLNR